MIKIFKEQKKVLIILGAIVILGAFLRFYNLGEVSFVADEFLDINASYGYRQTGEWQAWDFNLGEPAERQNLASDRRAWIYRIQVATLFDRFPPTESVARSVSVIWGIISMLLIYWIATYFTKKKEIGFIAAFLFAISVSGIIFDRRLRMYAMFFPVFLTFSWLLFRVFEEKYKGGIELIKSFSEKYGINLFWTLPMVLAGILSLHLHQLTASIAIIFLAYAIIQQLYEIRSNKPFWNKYSLVILTGILAYVAGIVAVPDVINSFTKGLKFFNDNYNYIEKVLVDYSHPLIAILFFTLGIYYLCMKLGKQKEATWLSVTFIVTLLAAIFIWRRNVGPQYIFFVQSFEIILIATGVYALADFLKNNLAKFGKRAFYVPLMLSLLILPNYGYFFEENNTYRQNSRSENPNYRKIFGYFKKHREDGDVLVTRDFRNYYWSGEGVKVYDFGGEVSGDKLTAEDLQQIINENKRGWVIISDNDTSYISNEADDYMEKNLIKINDIEVRGSAGVFKWDTGEKDLK